MQGRAVNLISEGISQRLTKKYTYYKKNKKKRKKKKEEFPE